MKCEAAEFTQEDIEAIAQAMKEETESEQTIQRFRADPCLVLEPAVMDDTRWYDPLVNDWHSFVPQDGVQVAGPAAPAPKAPRRVFVAPPAGSGQPTVTIPAGWIPTPAKNGKGTVWTNPKNPNEQIRIMDSGKYNPGGYVRNRDASGRYLDPDGKPYMDGKSPATHVDKKYRGPLRWFQNLNQLKTPWPMLLFPWQVDYLRCGQSPCPKPIDS